MTNWRCELASCEWQNYLVGWYSICTYLFILFFCLVVFYTMVYYDCFRFVCTFESFCLNNCKMKRSKQCIAHFIRVWRFCENEEMGIGVPSLLVVPYVCQMLLLVTIWHWHWLTLYRFGIIRHVIIIRTVSYTVPAAGTLSPRPKSRQLKFNCIYHPSPISVAWSR